MISLLLALLTSPVSCGTAHCTTTDHATGWSTICERDGARWLDAYGTATVMRSRDADGLAQDCPSETWWADGSCITCAEIAADPETFGGETLEDCETSR